MAILVILGPGGHASEIMRIVKTLKDYDAQCMTCFYLAARNDTLAECRVQDVEGNWTKEFFESKSPISLIRKIFANMLTNCFTTSFRTTKRPGSRFFHIPRVREVGQSLIWSVIPCIFSFFYSLLLLLCIRPKVILANGPALCVPVLWAAAFLNFLRIHPNTRIYVESLTCVDRLSLSGAIAYPIADAFLVHWSALERRYSKARTLKHIRSRLLKPITSPHDESYVLVTVGTTNFDDLVRICDTEWFSTFVKGKLGIKKIVIQIGSGTYIPVNCEYLRWFDSKTSSLLADAALVVCHGGAGTILDASEHNVPIIAVPNESLLNNHQLLLCKELHHQQCVVAIELDKFQEKISHLTGRDLRLRSLEYPSREICRMLMSLKH